MKPARGESSNVLPGDSLVPLASVLCTEELNRRPSRPPDYETENRALSALAQTLADSPATIFQKMAEVMLEIFRAGSAGFSLLTEDGTRFHWPAIAGMWKPCIGGGMPRDSSPCGIVLDRDAVQLFARPERYYHYLAPVQYPIVEALLAPFYVEGKAVGTMWVIVHDDRRKFDAEDLRQLENLGRFASVAYQTVASLQVSKQRGEVLRQSRTELQQAQNARRAALNLMEEAVQSRQAMERLNAELRESEERLAKALTATQQLHSISALLIEDGNADIIYQKILDAAVAIMQSDMASVQILDEDEDALRMLAWRGFDRTFAQIFEFNHPEAKTSCSAAWRAGHRVVVPDVEACDFIVGTTALEAHRKTGIRAVQSTPLFSRGGRLFGMISTHWHTPHTPSESDLRQFDILARQAADLIERKQTEETARQSAALFSTVVQQAPFGMYVVDAQLRLQQVNSRGLPVFGTIHPLIGREFSEVIQILWGPEVGRQIVDIFRHTLETGERYISPDFSERRHDLGVEQSYEWETQRVTFPNGAHAVVCYFIDITERRKAQEQLGKSEERARRQHAELELIYQNAPIGLCVLDHNFRFLRMNEQMAEISGRSVADHLGRTIREMLPDLADLLESIYRRVIDTGEPVTEVEVHGMTSAQPGIERDWLVSYVPVLDAHGTMMGIGCVLEEITQRKRAETTLRESEERLRSFAGQLEQLVQERTDELVQSHERLRSMATELNLAEHRERKRLAGVLHDYLAQLLVLCRLNLGQVRRVGLPRKAEEMVKETEEVLNQALSYSRTLMAELSPPVLQEHGLPAGLKWLSEQMQRHGLTVTVDVGDALGISIPEDRTMLLFQSVRELLMNALKHAGSKMVVVRMEQVEGRLRIEVRDDGSGFDLAAAAAAADVPTAMSTKFGLFSIRERMRALGGQFELESVLGQGTCATLVLPLVDGVAETIGVRRLHSQPIRYEPSVVSSASGNASPRTSHASRAIRVLLVDDHAMVRQGLRSVLESYTDVEVVGEALNGEEAVADVERLQPSIVVMDISMPKMNGIDATTEITSRYPDIIVIGLSVQAGGANEEAMRNAGAAMLLTKEAAVDELYRAIQETLAAKRTSKKRS